MPPNKVLSPVAVANPPPRARGLVLKVVFSGCRGLGKAAGGRFKGLRSGGRGVQGCVCVCVCVCVLLSSRCTTRAVADRTRQRGPATNGRSVARQDNARGRSANPPEPWSRPCFRASKGACLNRLALGLGVVAGLRKATGRVTYIRSPWQSSPSRCLSGFVRPRHPRDPSLSRRGRHTTFLGTPLSERASGRQVFRAEVLPSEPLGAPGPPPPSASWPPRAPPPGPSTAEFGEKAVLQLSPSKSCDQTNAHVIGIGTGIGIGVRYRYM